MPSSNLKSKFSFLLQRTAVVILALATWAIQPVQSRADSIWARRDPNFAYYFHDYRARNVGDVLTIIVRETTEMDGREKRELNKETKAGMLWSLTGKTSNPGVSRSFNADFNGQTSSQRKFDGKANNSIDRRFQDQVTATVVAVLPNGNLVIDGIRSTQVGRETRYPKVSGIVRPGDLGADNSISSQNVANFRMSYQGAGPDTNFTNQGWGGRLTNILWPY